MKDITMLQFRQNSEAIIRELRDGEQMTLTYRGQKVAKLVPIAKKRAKAQVMGNSIYDLLTISGSGHQDDSDMTNEKIDQILYGWNRACDP